VVSQSPSAPRLQAPEAIALDASGRVYFTDFEARRVYRIEGDGSLSLVAGTGQSGSTGDGGPATEAGLEEPAGIAIDSDGNIYIGEHHGHRIRRVGQNGIITTFAGRGTVTIPGSGPLHMGSEGAFSGDGGPATAAELSGPLGLAWSNGTLFIADAFNNRIRGVDHTGIISTVAGSGRRFSSSSADPDGLRATSLDLSQPWSLAVDRDGSLLVTDWTRFVIYRIDAAGIAHLVMGNGAAGFSGDGGPALKAETEGPYGIAVGPNGDIYFSEVGLSAGGNRIRRIDGDGVVSNIAGTGVAGYSGDGGLAVDAELNGPYGLAVDAAGNLYFADGGNHAVRMIDAGGIITTVAGG
jgi:sugar lactone lactonase YvrE